MGEIVEVADVVALVLELGAVPLAEELGDPLDVAKRVAEDVSVGGEKILLLPIVFPFLVARGHGIEREIHRAHVERAHFRREFSRRREPLLDRHDHRPPVVMLTTASVACLMRGRNCRRRRDRASAARPSGRAHAGAGWRRRLPPPRSPGCAICVGRDRQRVRHGRRVDRAGDGAGDDDLVGFRSQFRAMVHSRVLGLIVAIISLCGHPRQSASAAPAAGAASQSVADSPQMPLGANSMTAIATAPRMRR